MAITWWLSTISICLHTHTHTHTYIYIYLYIYIYIYKSVKVKWSRYRPNVAQRVGRGLALFFHDRGTRRGWVISSTPRPHFTPGKDPLHIFQEAGWAPRPVWTGGKSLPHRDLIPDRAGRSQLLYRLSCRPITYIYIYIYIYYKSQYWMSVAMNTYIMWR